MTTKVLLHVHDKDADVYRLHIGYFEEVVIPPPEDEEDAEPTTALRQIGEEDFVWADDDPRWQDKLPDEIAELQTRDIRDLLVRRALDAEESQAKVTEMPGTAGMTL